MLRALCFVLVLFTDFGDIKPQREIPVRASSSLLPHVTPPLPSLSCCLLFRLTLLDHHHHTPSKPNPFDCH